MKEDFLHYIWQYQKFNKAFLKTTFGEEITVLKIGFHNTDSGPDFKEARIKIGDVEWAGSVEIHLKASDWNLHKHDTDLAYENVVLHVVWENDKEILNKDGKPIPTLTLKALTDISLLDKYEALMQSQNEIPCQNQFSEIASIKKFSMLEKALLQRMQRKGAEVSERFEKLGNDWEEVTYQILLRNFGFKLNNEVFLCLAENLPYKILRKYSSSCFQVEALLFGMAGFLEGDLDEYGFKLKVEFDFLAAKHNLKDKVLNSSQWKFMRTRPANFPTVRLSQLAALMSQSKGLFATMTSASDYKMLVSFFEAKPSIYWQKHYHFNKESAQDFKGIGKSSIHNLVINTVVPVLVAYAEQIDNQLFIENAMALLEKIPAEKNKITKFWNSLDLETKTMFDSQGSIELYNEFCMKKKCLSCGVGIGILG
ncbi:DUF2851 family protein [Arcticibacterium luteifluviistationis]|uniref:DUF2851 domain-containing protein n=1 Tax=Arcticibacterium luteifluviistationis TaxID=1784714 RepID=A0A2Z4GGP9_9BACT|nr:DUF2851 family protein [Arcticibacterium luteifluviistationis]AWW00573.1 DUF2851 domain-containing protein [Arcticibacterium luteifluviistationis]